MKKANEYQVGGDHYKVGGEEHWDRAWRLKWDPFQYQITKYVERWKEKGGVDDLRKAQHFLQKYIELLTEPDPVDKVSRRKDGGWLGFTLEGIMGDGREHYKCQTCKQELWVPAHWDPQEGHSCPSESSHQEQDDKHDHNKTSDPTGPIPPT
jgi:hypothetical protein